MDSIFISFHHFIWFSDHFSRCLSSCTDFNRPMRALQLLCIFVCLAVAFGTESDWMLSEDEILASRAGIPRADLSLHTTQNKIIPHIDTRTFFMSLYNQIEVSIRCIWCRLLHVLTERSEHAFSLLLLFCSLYSCSFSRVFRRPKLETMCMPPRSPNHYKYLYSPMHRIHNKQKNQKWAILSCEVESFLLLELSRACSERCPYFCSIRSRAHKTKL